jgi:hypothetical protein
MRHQFKRAVINLDGHSCKMADDENVLLNICRCLKMLGIEFSIYEPHTRGFKILKEDMNQPDTLYILNDSLQYHLCDMPCILLTRSPSWVQGAPKQNTIGVVTKEMISSNYSYLMALIYRNEQTRQFSDYFAARTYLVVNDYISENMDVMHRHSMAMITWNHLSKQDIHFSTSFHQSEGLPFVNDILREGLELLSHPDDILLIANRDICLVNESTAIIRAYMDSLNLDCCYARRVDVKGIPHVLSYTDIQQYPTSPGLDLFAFRKNAACLPEILEANRYLGRIGWDGFWADKMKNELPFKVCYHQEHHSDWTTPKGRKENLHNIKTISNKEVGFGVMCNEFGVHYTQPI